MVALYVLRMSDMMTWFIGFVEVETPTLHRRSPMGAREFLVPTRDNGKFYSLIQSPQQVRQRSTFSMLLL